MPGHRRRTPPELSLYFHPESQPQQWRDVISQRDLPLPFHGSRMVSTLRCLSVRRMLLDQIGTQTHGLVLYIFFYTAVILFTV